MTNSGNWGRSIAPTLGSIKVVKGTLLFAPVLVYLFLSGTPSFNVRTSCVVVSWVVFQFGLARLPNVLTFWGWYTGGYQQGQVTPAGNTVVYNINGLQSLIISLILFRLIGNYTWIATHWGQIFVTANILGYALSLIVYLKAVLFPNYTCYPRDRKETNNRLYDFFLGVEFNPSLFGVDLKLFLNGRPGIIGWALIDFSFATLCYQRHGGIPGSMIVVIGLQLLYIIDFFWNERWYLKTIDIAHDHFGWYLIWGDCVWLPFMYTLQVQYLCDHPVDLGLATNVIILLIGLVGYLVFRWSNYQKDHFRRTDGTQKLWGKMPDFIKCSFQTKDNRTHHTKLLCSGFWGMARHMNYTGDLILSLCFSLPCGAFSFKAYFYPIYMTVMLLLRCFRDEDRCSRKYQSPWKVYCKKVKYRFIPGVF